MKVVIAIDSFKGSLSSVEAGNAAAKGVRRVFPDAECIVSPLADGGEGTVDALVTGEGRLDGQTAMGKAPNEAGIDAYFPILRRVVTLEEALDRTAAAENLADAVEQAFRLL